LNGYYVETYVDKEGPHLNSTRLTHLSQVDAHFPVGVGSSFRLGWAKNLHKLKTFVDKNPLIQNEPSALLNLKRSSMIGTQLTEGNFFLFSIENQIK